MATAIEFGAVAACIVLKPMLPYFMDIARGYPYYPPAIVLDHAPAASADVVSGAGNLTLIGGNVTDSNRTGASDEESPFPSVQKEILLGWIWVASSLLVAATSAYRDKSFSNFNLIGMIRPGYSAISTMDDADEAAAKAAAAALLAAGGGGANGSSSRKVLPAHRDPPMVHDAYNMFDPADLPPRLAEYANMVYSACEDLGNFFGFQDSSVRNQAEHLLILLSNNRRYMSSHILPPSVQPPSPIHALHAKVFSNYVKWCRAMGVPPHFSKMNTSMNAPPAVASRVVDLVLFFCIWGEGANLRHIPECIWFLYHKMMEEYIQSEGYTQTRSLYAGHYLDNVVTPIYEVIAKVRRATVFS
jgi:callose synthase